MTVVQVESAVDGRAASSTTSWSTSQTLPVVDADGAREDTAVAGRDDDGRNASSIICCNTSSTARLVAVPGRDVETVNILSLHYCKDFTKLATMRLPLLVMMLSG